MNYSTLSYDLASRRDTDELVALYREFYPTLGWTQDLLEWQYFKNPSGDARIWTARDGGRIVATYVGIPHRVHLHGKIATGWRIQDVLTRPEYRGFGIYHSLFKMAKKYLTDPVFPMNFTFPNEKSHNGFVTMGWVPAVRIPLRVLDNLGPAHRQKSIPAEVSPTSFFSSENELVWRSHVKRYRFAIDRSADYLNWRYVKHPREKYFSYALRSGADEAVLILKYYDRENGERWAHICDYFQRGTDQELAGSAVAYAVDFAVGHGAKAVSGWCPKGDPLAALLDHWGFLLQENLTRWLVVNVNSDSITQETVCNEGIWHLSMGDSDVY